ncbi:hypothetical protein P6709_00355 [Jeotgalibacillus sp. ET6]|uniref:hypothetical protein n=1 Tax=Jeotgalibacillus sp. ET6 TaxID=3037260 RepID=UPI00241855B1|nr:hypothetical protein [Jeotgalibacillus sp. ET6]MDG5470175.1 hypothetical protein [Jeotgalibacillus sp. ET6]
MDINLIWEDFVQRLSKTEGITGVRWKKIAGIPFLYISVDGLEKERLHYEIRKNAGRAMRGKRLHAETVPVRQNQDEYVFRHRFYVPQEKMFCCGNLCPDCIRFK